MKRHKKSIIYPDQARQWLARYESGEALRTIAEADDFDIRTVKRQVEEADFERMTKEVRASVLRAALEKHFADIANLAEKLRSAVAELSPIRLEADEACLLNGLKQHLPRSPLWEYLDGYQKVVTLSEFKDRFEGAKNERESLAEMEDKPASDTSYGRVFFNPDFMMPLKTEWSAEPGIDALATSQLYAKERLENLNFTEPTSPIPGKIKSNLKSDPGIKRLQGHLRDELTKIILRRVVPGRCGYCPL